MTARELVEMKLHESRKIEDASFTISVRRVIGGWIYTTIGWNNAKGLPISMSQCFVPLSDDIVQH
jgi:hypothetical protein